MEGAGGASMRAAPSLREAAQGIVWHMEGAAGVRSMRGPLIWRQEAAQGVDWEEYRLNWRATYLEPLTSSHGLCGSSDPTNHLS